MTIRNKYSDHEFKVNDFITLRLEHEGTIIYVANQPFEQCKYLLLSIPVDKIESFNDIDSIDDAAERLDRSMEGDGRYHFDLTPEMEFWGHCSNLQCWSELNYDTRILHSNLAFPLLRRLVDVGDTKARKVFKDEVANRYTAGNSQVKKFLEIEGYLNIFNKEEINLLNQQIQEQIEGRLKNEDISVLHEFFIDEDEPYYYNRIREIYIKKKANSIQQALELILKEDELEYLKYSLKGEYLNLLIEHPKLNLIGVLSKVMEDFYYFFEILESLNIKEPITLKQKMLELIVNEDYDWKYILFLIIYVKNIEFIKIIKKLGISIIREAILKLINNADYPEDIYILLNSPHLEELIKNKKISLLKIICNYFKSEFLSSFFHKFGHQNPELLKQVYKTNNYLKKMFNDFNFDIDHFLLLKQKEEIEILKPIKKRSYINYQGPRRYNNSKTLRIRHSNFRRISEIPEISDNQELKALRLMDGQIIEIDGLENLSELEVLDLTNNQISEIKGLDNLTNLRVLSLGNNNITKIEGLESLTKLEELDLNDNQITIIKGLENLTSLKKIRLYHNQIASEILNFLDPIAYVIKPLEFVKYCQDISIQNKEIN